jgi:predicted dehydrogenase
MKPLRFGILGTAGIARKNWKAIFHSGNCTVTAVASRELDRARQFIAENQRETPFPTTPTPFGSYEALLASPDVDAVYLPLPTALRKEWVLHAAAARKHIVCEKPCAISAPDLDEMLAACRQHRVQFLDGVMFMHAPRLAALRQLLDDGDTLGELRRITSQFTFLGHDGFLEKNIRAQAHLEPLGCLGDLGWYNLRFALWANRWQLPRTVTAQTLRQTETGVPLDFSGELQFPNGVSSGFYCSFVTFRQQWANVGGTRGYLQVHDFVNPFYGHETGFDVTQILQDGPRAVPHVRRVTVPGHACAHPTAPEAALFRNFAAQVATGQINPDWPEWARLTQLVSDACLTSAKTGKPVTLPAA